MDTKFSTAGVKHADRGGYWNDAVCGTYFPLDPQFKSTVEFNGVLNSWDVGTVSLSRLWSDGILYRRHHRHCLREREESYLITIPTLSDIQFRQDGKEACCKPGQFLVQRSHLPYEFSHADPIALWVLKVPTDVLRSRIVMPERLASLSFDATQGPGALFVDMIQLVGGRLDDMDTSVRQVSGKYLVDLLSVSISSDERTINPNASSVQIAHLCRVENFIRNNLASSELHPQTIADACGISVRYLHQLFSSQGRSVGEWIKLQRLLICNQMLRDPHCHKKVCEIAYEWGFSDQAQFSRLYRAEFGSAPSETRELTRSANSNVEAVVEGDRRRARGDKAAELHRWLQD